MDSYKSFIKKEHNIDNEKIEKLTKDYKKYGLCALCFFGCKKDSKTLICKQFGFNYRNKNGWWKEIAFNDDNNEKIKVIFNINKQTNKSESDELSHSHMKTLIAKFVNPSSIEQIPVEVPLNPFVAEKIEAGDLIRVY